MKSMKYDSSMPLARLEKGDKAIIRVYRNIDSLIPEKEKKKYGNIPNGKYEAVCVGDCKLECKEYPMLNGKYCFWHGNKWGTHYGIYADEFIEMNL
ncbi:hypothetical protein [Clostridium botulinum]|uniref:hypothetical protein n=1 Tax=Clostridium botulinum TaxID=1491 RepID=UPI0005F8B15F